MGQLSPTGKPAAVFGLLFFSFLTYSSATRSGIIGGSSPVVEEKKQWNVEEDWMRERLY